MAQAKRHGGTWSGTAEQLLAAIDHERPDDPRAAWPSNAWSLSSALTRNQETLRAAGLGVERGKSHGKKTIRLVLEVAPDAD